MRLATIKYRGDANLQDPFVKDQKAKLASRIQDGAILIECLQPCKIGRRSLQQGEIGWTVIVQGSF